MKALHPSQFVVNEAWVLFQLLDQPIFTTQDGPAVCFGLMDAASCFLLSVQLYPGVGMEVLTQQNVQELLKNGWAHKRKYPNRLLIPKELLTSEVQALAEAQGITVVCASERELKGIIGEAQKEFRQRFS